jgi:hypothetical protein
MGGFVGRGRCSTSGAGRRCCRVGAGRRRRSCWVGFRAGGSIRGRL